MPTDYEENGNLAAWPPEDLVLTVDPVLNSVIFKEWKEKHGFKEY
jgi:hypothetical protein